MDPDETAHLSAFVGFGALRVNILDISVNQVFPVLPGTVIYGLSDR